MITKSEANAVVEQMPSKFNSHQFITRYILCYTWSYLSILKEYKDVEIAHREIGKFLKKNDTKLGIKKTGLEPSENIFGNIDNIASWEKTTQK
ncbi:MAG: hypothetical protein IKH61_06415 [Bacteroidales bacterium]|nr:hypothetical protein [Bacteroidales bacterium]